jgi:PAS domain S-box-containing protein
VTNRTVLNDIESWNSFASTGKDLLRALARLLELAASREPLATLLGELLRFAEELTPDMRCSILLADLSAGVLRCGAAPSLPIAYSQAIDRLPIADGIGSCGTAAARRGTVIVGNIARSPLWRDYADLAAEHGLAACWSVPLMDSRGDLLGTCAMYCSQPRTPTAAEEHLYRITGKLAAMAIQRHRDAERLQISEARYRQLADLCPDAVIVHCDGCVTYANRAAAELLHQAGPEAMVAQNIEKLTSAECEHDFVEHRAGVLAARLNRSDGTKMHVEITASQLPMDGQMMTLMVGRDVTEQRKLENELLEMGSRERAQLAYDLHDGLGQQLISIGLFIRGLGNQIVRHLPAGLGENLIHIRVTFLRTPPFFLDSVGDSRGFARVPGCCC